MDLYQLLTQIAIAIVCAGLANVLIPRRVPGKLAGLILIGFAGVWLGDWAYNFVQREYGLSIDLLNWQVQGVEIIPSIIGSAVILYVLTAFLKWGRYT
jgi:uncharacterized membrane protein YeaQ/YmgE (transglycosylase-associated protein family)